MVATFTTADLNSLADDFAALLDWGDGTTDAGAISGGNGSFTVSADHVYAETGSYAVSIEILDGLTGASTSDAATATVADGTLTLTGFQMGDPMSDQPSSYVFGVLTDYA